MHEGREEPGRDRAERIGRYELRGELGRGGMGVVYRAHDLQLRRPVALKLLPDAVGGDPARRARFLREARTAGRVSHPNVATVYDFGELPSRSAGEPGKLFLAMELVEGRDLRQVARERELSTADIARIGRQIAAALDAAHEQRLVHRDLKPGNVLLRDDGLVKVLDFGLAKRLTSEDLTTLDVGEPVARTAPGAVLGTVGYMAPEQLRVGAVDGRADLFALGVILYELATGARPFPTDSLGDYLLAVERRSPPRLERLAPQHAELAPLVRRLLDRDPAKRPASARELLEPLDRIAGSELTSRAPTSILPVAVRRSGRGVVALALLLALLAAAAWWWWGRERSPALPGEPLRLAILPFENRTDRGALDALVLGLRSQLAQRLDREPGVEVLGSSLVAALAARDDVDAELAARGAQRVLSVRLAAVGEGEILEAALRAPGESSPAWRERLALDETRLPELQADLHDRLRRALGLPAEQDGGGRPPPTSSNRAYRAFLQGTRFLAEGADIGDLDVAIHHLEEALRADPDFAYARAALSLALLRRHDVEPLNRTLEAAISEAERALALDPELGEAHWVLAAAYRQAGRLAEARRWLERARALPEQQPAWLGDLGGGLAAGAGASPAGSDGRARALVELAWSQVDAGDWEPALATFREATTVAPGDWTVWRDLGGALMRRGRYDEARSALREALRVAPEDQRLAPSENLMLIELLEGDPQGALEVFRRLDVPVVESSFASNVGVAHYEAGDLERAAQYFELATRLAPGRQILRGNLADALLRLGRVEEARRELETAVDLVDERLAAFPESNPLKIDAAYYRAKLGRCDEAVERADALREETPPRGERWRQLAISYALCERAEPALDALERALAAGASASMLADADELDALREDPRFQRLVGR